MWSTRSGLFSLLSRGASDLETWVWCSLFASHLQSTPFFTEQLTAFEVWLDHGSERKKPPEQLPIVLQVAPLIFFFSFVVKVPLFSNLMKDMKCCIQVFRLLQKTCWCVPHFVVTLCTQVLLSQSHRSRALLLLGRFLDMGAWAVDLVSTYFLSRLLPF